MMLFLLGMVPGTSLTPSLLVLESIGQPTPFDRGAVPVLEVGTIVEALRQYLGGTHD